MFVGVCLFMTLLCQARYADSLGFRRYLAFGGNLINAQSLPSSSLSFQLTYVQEITGSFGQKDINGPFGAIGVGQNYVHIPAGILIGLPLRLLSYSNDFFGYAFRNYTSKLMMSEGYYFECSPSANVHLYGTFSPLRFTRLRDGHPKEDRFFLSVASSVGFAYRVQNVRFELKSEINQMYTNRAPIVSAGGKVSILF